MDPTTIIRAIEALMSPLEWGSQEAWLADHRGSVIIDGAGHWVQQEAPEQVNAALLDFCDQLRGGTNL